MNNIISRSFTIAIAAALAACSSEAPSAPRQQPAVRASLLSVTAEDNKALAALRRATARYQDLTVALDEDFVLLHPCEARDEGPVGEVYVHFGRLLDGVIDPESPDALVYEPGRDGGRPQLVAAEFAIPYAMVAEAPQFQGATFQREDEFGVYALHAWVWRDNPNGLFAETNPRVSCGQE
jgi:hypothetical protein